MIITIIAMWKNFKKMMMMMITMINNKMLKLKQVIIMNNNDVYRFLMKMKFNQLIIISIYLLMIVENKSFKLI